ncbi:MAG TPA: hypothetical protein VF163_12075, partial [Micromonosporaceae bacterium]
GAADTTRYLGQTRTGHGTPLSEADYNFLRQVDADRSIADIAAVVGSGPHDKAVGQAVERAVELQRRGLICVRRGGQASG